MAEFLNRVKPMVQEKDSCNFQVVQYRQANTGELLGESYHVGRVVTKRFLDRELAQGLNPR